MKVQLLLPFLFGTLYAFALMDKQEEGSTESPDEALKFLKRSSEKCQLGKSLTSRIIRGQEANKNQFPWILSLRANKIHFCAGSLITDKYVLTAANCFDFGKIANYVGEKDNTTKHMLTVVKVVLGDHSVNTDEPGEQIFGIAQFRKLEPVTNRSGVPLLNDVAVAKLDGTAKLNSYVSTVCLANSEIGVSPRTELTVAGWGYTQHPIYDKEIKVKYPNKFSDVLKVAKMLVVLREDCANRYHPKDNKGYPIYFGHPVGEDIICTREEFSKGGTSKTDTGSPLMYFDQETKQYVQVGIRSYNWGRNGENAFSSVLYFLPTIEGWIKELEANQKQN